MRYGASIRHGEMKAGQNCSGVDMGDYASGKGDSKFYDDGRSRDAEMT